MSEDVTMAAELAPVEPPAPPMPVIEDPVVAERNRILGIVRAVLTGKPASLVAALASIEADVAKG